MEPSSESDGPVTTVKSPLTLLFAGITLGLCALLSACGQPPPEPAAPTAARHIAFVGVGVLSMAGEVAAVPDQTVLVSGGAARFLETDSEVGTVEVGKRADLILLDANPLESIDALRNPAGVMVRGGWSPRETLAGNRARGVS